MDPLPIDSQLAEIAKVLARNGAAVVVAPPGAGKTTRVAPALLATATTAGRILLVQPRRIAAITAATRIAEERQWSLGGEVGYRVRFARKTSRQTRLEVVTDGILLRLLQRDPFLEGVACVILDEFHERRLSTDLALGLLQEVRMADPHHPQLVVMSATLDADAVCDFLRPCLTVETQGRRHPVDLQYHPSASRPIGPAVLAVLQESWQTTSGHVLVFLPGMREIRQLLLDLQPFAQREGAVLFALHGQLSLDEQRRALAPTTLRKILLATNVAETSLTIDGVHWVIDSGLHRQLRHSPQTGLDQLELLRISQHSAEQRSGRAGRQGPGHAHRLWSEQEQKSLTLSHSPEVQRVDLTDAFLQLLAWGADPGRFRWLDAPPERHAAAAFHRLGLLGALTESGALTRRGQEMAQLPLPPRLAALLFAAHRQGCTREAALCCALLEERDILNRVTLDAGNQRSGPSDLLRRVDLFVECEKQGFSASRVHHKGADLGALRRVQRLREDLTRIALQRLGPEGPAQNPPLLRLLLQAFPDRVARRREAGSPRALMVGGRGVLLAKDSVVREGEFLLALRCADGGNSRPQSETRVLWASMVEKDWLEEDLPHLVKERSELRFDQDQEKVVAASCRVLLDLPLETPRRAAPAADEASELLARVVRDRVTELIASQDEAHRWVQRVRCLGDWLPQLELPRYDSEQLAAALTPLCHGRTSLRALRDQNLAEWLRSQLPFELRQRIDREAPDRFQVPSGSSLRLHYERGQPALLSVRIQELFGLPDTPRIAAGSVPILLELLGPHGRPVQRTQDLKNFWTQTYAQVRKDLRGRYPKHSWPEDPLTAEPVRGVRRRR